MYRLEKVGCPLVSKMWNAICIEYAEYYQREYEESGQKFLRGIAYYIKEVSSIASKYKATYNCHLILTGKGDSGKTFFLSYLSRSILTTDQRLKLTIGKELCRSKDSLISICK